MRDAVLLRSTTPMLLADDRRRYVGANAAACLFLRLSREAILRRSVDDLVPAEARAGLEATWSALLREGTRSGAVELAMPNGTRVVVDQCATANVMPGRHLQVLAFPAAGASDKSPPGTEMATRTTLTRREREVLSLVAAGHTGTRIGTELFLSPATVQTHVRNALIKLRARNRAHGIALALKAGELDRGSRTEAGPDRHLLRH